MRKSHLKSNISYFLFQNIHSEMYSLLIETYIEDSAEK